MKSPIGEDDVGAVYKISNDVPEMGLYRGDYVMWDGQYWQVIAGPRQELTDHMLSDIDTFYRAIGGHDESIGELYTDVAELKENFTSVADGKALVETAVIDKGGTVSKAQDVATFQELADGVGTIPSGGDLPDVQPLDPYEVYRDTRPADWLPMPADEDVQNDEIYLLFHLAQTDENYIAFEVRCTGNWTVELGTMVNGSFVARDELTSTYSSGATYSAALDYADWEDDTNDEYRQVMIRVYGEKLSYWAIKAISSGSNSRANWNIVEIKCRLPELKTIQLQTTSSQKYSLIKLRYFSCLGSNKITTCNSLFGYCYSLITILSLDTSSAKSTGSMFSNCGSLVAIPVLNTSAVTQMGSMFSDCGSLCALPMLDTHNVTDMTRSFFGCKSLHTLPLLDTSNVTSFNQTFTNCNSLVYVPQLNTSSAIDTHYMFSSCLRLRTVPLFDTTNVTDMGGMFNGDNLLVEIPAFNTSKCRDMSSMFYNCWSLKRMPSFDTANVTTMGNMFTNCYSLEEVVDLDITNSSSSTNPFSSCYSLLRLTVKTQTGTWDNPQNLSISGGALSRAALIELFNSLPVITTEKSLSIVGNPGTSKLTDEDKAIAIGKGWTLTQ